MSPAPRGGQYSVDIIHVSIQFVLKAAMSMRATAAALAILAERQFLDFVTPSASALRWWLIRLGCYALTRPLERATDWVWLIDHTAQIGDRKLFAILGCRLSDIPFGRALCLADLKLIALVPMEKSNRETVAAILEEAQLRTGVPRQIVSDGGSDVRGGSERFIENHPETTWALDVVHAAANALETVWERDPRWHEFLRQLSETNQKIRQTKAAFLLAPLHRQKVRFMKVGITIRFATRVLRLLDAPVPLPAAEEKYGWLRAYRDDVAHWRDEHRIVETTVAIVRRDGLNASTRQAVEDAWGDLGKQEQLVMVVGRMRAYLNVQTRTVRPGETLVGSTEALEAAFGKWKRLEGDQSTSGLTTLVLSFGAMVSECNEEDIREALDAVPEKTARGWTKRNIGESIQWLRRQLFSEPEPG